jgi:hypothetical protein
VFEGTVTAQSEPSRAVTCWPGKMRVAARASPTCYGSSVNWPPWWEWELEHEGVP